MSKSELAAQFHKEGYNCAQAVLLAYAQECGLTQEEAAKIAQPFGAGMGQLREVCGAFSGALMALGMMQGKNDPKDKAAKQAMYAKVFELGKTWEQEHGSLICAKLLAQQAEGGPKKASCRELVSYAAGLIENVKEV